MTLYQRIRAERIEHEHHYSDLRFPVNTKTSRIVDEYRRDNGNNLVVSTFRDNISGTLWYDVFGAYDPYWEKSNAKGR